MSASPRMQDLSNRPPMPSPPGFGEFAGEVRRVVELRLAELLRDRLARVRASGPEVVSVVEALSALALRGGKRLRAVLLALAYESSGGATFVDVEWAATSLELLQAYLLIHDDWMDHDELRRGGPSVHAALRDRFASVEVGDAGAILAGDYAAALAQEALLATPLAADRVRAAAQIFARIQTEVVEGQMADALGVPSSLADVERTYALKTASYTVKGPLLMGAALSGATDAAMRAFERFAVPLGVAFQFRDDLIGAFGSSELTGKPCGSDLRRGKRTALVVELYNDRGGAALLDRVLGVEDAPEDEISAVLSRMSESGARHRVEARLAALLDEARAGLDSIPVSTGAKARLQGALEALGIRES